MLTKDACYYQASTAVFTDHLWTNHPRRMLLPGVNGPNVQEKALTQHINMVRQMKGTHMSWRGRQQAKTQWSQSKQTGARRLREIGKRETECESDGWSWCTQTRENFRSSKFQGSPVTLYLTISLSWCQRPIDLVICKLYFEGGGGGGGEASTKKKEEMLDQDVISPYYHRRSVKCTHCLVLHAGEYHIQHLREGGFGRGLVDEVLTGQIDVVARSYGLQHRTFVDLYLLGGHGCKQGL